jgi:hypothetical protein
MAILSSKGKLATLVTLSLLLILAALPAQAYWGNPVDHFDTTQAKLTANSSTPVQRSTADGTDILGGERDLEVGFTSGSNSVTAQVGSGFLSHSQESLAQGYTFVSWDGNDGDPATLNKTGLGVDLTNGGNADRFYIFVVSCDWGTTLTIDVYTNASNWARGTVSVPGSTLNHLFELPFANLVNQLGSVTWNNVGAITMDIDGRTVADLDVTIDYFGPGGPTAVDVASFTAAPAGRDILLTWETASEVDLLGFNLYRSDAVDGSYVQLNDALILAQQRGQPIGDVYTWSDGDVQAGATYSYRLEALELGGGVSSFGPVSAVVEGVPMHRLLPVRPRPAPLAPALQGR